MRMRGGGGLLLPPFRVYFQSTVVRRFGCLFYFIAEGINNVYFIHVYEL